MGDKLIDRLKGLVQEWMDRSQRANDEAHKLGLDGAAPMYSVQARSYYACVKALEKVIEEGRPK